MSNVLLTWKPVENGNLDENEQEAIYDKILFNIRNDGGYGEWEARIYSNGFLWKFDDSECPDSMNGEEFCKFYCETLAKGYQLAEKVIKEQLKELKKSENQVYDHFENLGEKLKNAEIEKLQKLNESLAERIAAQSELLSKRAENPKDIKIAQLEAKIEDLEERLSWS